MDKQLMRDTFYSLKHLDLKQKEELLRESQALSFNCYVDEKDNHYHRVPSKTTFEEMIQKMDSTCHYVFIERNITYGKEKPFIETGFCTMGEKVPGDWFLWIYLEQEHFNHFKEKYNLTKL